MGAHRTFTPEGWEAKTLTAARSPVPPADITGYQQVTLQWTQLNAVGAATGIEIWISSDEDPTLKDFTGDPSGDGRFFQLKDDAGVAVSIPDKPAGVANSSGGQVFALAGGAYIAVVFTGVSGSPEIQFRYHLKEHGR